MSMGSRAARAARAQGAPPASAVPWPIAAGSGLRGFGRRLGGNASHALRRLAARAALGPTGAIDRLWLLVRIGPLVLESRPPRLVIGPERPISVVDLLRALDDAAHDPRIGGVLLRFEGPGPGFARAAALRRAVRALRDAGKRTLAFSEGYDVAQYYVASAAEHVDLLPSGSLHLVGLRAAQYFGREALRKLGVEPQVVRVGSHKAAAEPLLRRAMSPEQREQVEQWQGAIFDELVGAIAQGRGLAKEVVREAIDAGPFSAPAAVERGLVDGTRYPDEIEQSVREATGAEGSRTAPFVDVASYHALRGGGWRPLLRELPRLAWVVARGAIHRGRSPRGIASQTYAELLARLRVDDEVRGVVLRIDSGGGDAAASDLLHRALARLGEEKPLVVSMGEVAASGGYFMAAAGAEVFAERATLTGSIGVLGGKLDLAGLYSRLGIDVDAVEQGEHAGLLAETRGFTPTERAALQSQLAAVYDTFVDRVAAGRGLERGAVLRAAQGRIYGGAAACERGLVDSLGGPLEALAAVRARAGIGADEPHLLDVLPVRPSLPLLRGWLGTRVGLG